MAVRTVVTYGGGSTLMRRLAERDRTLVHTCNHFIAMERPDAHVADIRAFFAALD
ncbi:hypothetical protein ABZW96_37185 [Nocardia sp. NPDC004168]|uniref:hypothetical protein n=1 Tax=Nocardia sp. NPDC004168 TaxID=3154452 RepID=UPI0033A483E8